jgi:hypothetical protein
VAFFTDSENGLKGVVCVQIALQLILKKIIRFVIVYSITVRAIRWNQTVCFFARDCGNETER